MSDWHELKKQLAQRTFDYYDKTLEAYYYCNHTKKRAQLRKKLARQWEMVEYYLAYRERGNKPRIPTKPGVSGTPRVR